MTFRYIGSKTRLTEPLAIAMERMDDGTGRFIDAFSGTGAVSEIAASLGWPVWANDALESAIVMTAARLAATPEIRMERLGGYAAAIERLNNVRPVQGPMWRTYSPASAQFDRDQIERRYFTEQNAAAVDAVRARIATWAEEGLLTDAEEQLLIGDLISAANRVANIAGTYGCFLSRWQNCARNSLELRPRQLKAEPADLITTVADVADMRPAANDLVYLDPPYTKRQYASYYHILETIAVGDEPDVEGVSGLRPWKEKASAFCYKTKALDALVSLVERMAARRVLISYSCQGHVDLDQLSVALSRSGGVECTPVHGVGRYRPNRTASANGGSVTEYILSYRRAQERAEAAPSPRGSHCIPTELVT
jgi:adenine-specific DNA-methyltransferase